MILVAGATGALGGMVSQGLLGGGAPVRTLVRVGSNYAGLVEAGAEPVTGDLKDPESLARACAGISTVVTTANSAGRSGDDTVDSVEIHGNRALIDAARAAGVEHFVFVSALGASPQSPAAFLRGKAQAESHLRSSGMSYTILRPDMFMEVWFGLMIGMPLQRGEPITLIDPARARHTFVSRRDVAAFVTAAARGSGRDETVVVGGPDSLSWRDVVAAAEHVIGRGLTVNYVAPGTPLPGRPEVVSQLASGFESYDTVFEMTDTAAAFGVQLTSAAECLSGMLRPAMPA